MNNTELRNQTEEEAIGIDNNIEILLQLMQIPHTVEEYNRENSILIADRIMEKLNG